MLYQDKDKRLNRTFMELKLMLATTPSLVELSLNRTFMELKLALGRKSTAVTLCLNRTFMELKQEHGMLFVMAVMS